MQHLPLEEKQKMLPIVLLAPWLNSISFENTIEIISSSIGEIPIIVDLDRYFSSSSELPSRKFFKKLIDPVDGFREWVQFVSRYPNFIPAVQLFGQVRESIEYQVEAFRGLGRGYVFRIELDKSYEFDMIFDCIKSSINDNIICIFDYGYGDPNEIIENNLSKLIDRLIEISVDAKFVITGSNFPNEFSQFDDFAEAKPIGTRILFENLSVKYGNYNIYYGDWASTKPRRYDGGGSRPLPRIDFPTRLNWIIARSKEEEWDFEDAAQRIVRLPEWADRPQVWGAGMIEKTARSLPGGISTGPEAIACRVNIHLYVQNNFASPGQALPPKGKWIDPI